MRMFCTTLNVFFLLSIFLVSTACSEQLGGAKGKVIDALSGLPISGAEVVATTETNIESEQRYKKIIIKTGKDGTYQIKGLRNKHYKIKVFKKDYFSMDESVTIPEKSNLLMEDIVLFPIPLHLFTFSDLTAKDKETGLMWTKNASMDAMNWDKANDFIHQLNEEKFAGYNDWSTNLK